MTPVLACRGGGGLLGVFARDTGEAEGTGVTEITGLDPGLSSELAAEGPAAPINN